MIIWIASYPKSGNTWVRSLLTAYLFTNDGKFNFELLNNIKQFSSKNISTGPNDITNYQSKISKNWIPAQKIINQDKKIHFFKTHNAFCSINNNKFTDKLNTAGVIYIVRDPRNLIMSLSHHYEINLEEAFNFLTNKRKIIFPKNILEKNMAKNVPDDFSFLGDWPSHYKSWKNINFCPIKIIKYEDILADAREVFISILNFLSQFIKLKFDEKKINNALVTTSFEKLSQMEIQEGFYESIISSKTKKKIKFFNLGKKNNWKKLLKHKIVKKVDNNFKNEMNELNYL